MSNDQLGWDKLLNPDATSDEKIEEKVSVHKTVAVTEVVSETLTELATEKNATHAEEKIDAGAKLRRVGYKNVNDRTLREKRLVAARTDTCACAKDYG